MKRVLIIGGSGGIGAATVEKFTKKGHAVVFTYHSNANAARELATKTNAQALFCDLASEESITKTVQNAIGLLDGKIDVLVNAAGIADIKLFTDVTSEEQSKLLSVDLASTLLVTRAVLPYMIRAHYGKIVNVGSMWGKIGASCEVVYSTAKAGIEGFTKALAKEVGPSGITVNCVEPGLIDTPMNKSLDDEAKKALADETPLCRIGTPKEVAEAIYFFASDRSSFITGQILGVDGGYAI